METLFKLDPEEPFSDRLWSIAITIVLVLGLWKAGEIVLFLSEHVEVKVMLGEEKQ